MSPSDTSQALYDKERHKGDWKGKKEIEGGIEREIETEHPLCVYSCVNQQGLWWQHRTHACDRVLLNNKEYLCPCGSGLSGCEMKITPHTGLIYFNQIWPKPDKCWIPPLCSSILCVLRPLPPSLQAELSSLVSLAPLPHSPAWMKSHFLPLKPSRSHSLSVTSDPVPQKPFRKWLHFQLSIMLILNPEPLFHDIFHKMNVLDLSGSAVLYISHFDFTFSTHAALI